MQGKPSELLCVSILSLPTPGTLTLFSMALPVFLTCHVDFTAHQHFSSVCINPLVIFLWFVLQPVSQPSSRRQIAEEQKPLTADAARDQVSRRNLCILGGNSRGRGQDQDWSSAPELWSRCLKEHVSNKNLEMQHWKEPTSSQTLLQAPQNNTAVRGPDPACCDTWDGKPTQNVHSSSCVLSPVPSHWGGITCTQNTSGRSFPNFLRLPWRRCHGRRGWECPKSAGIAEFPPTASLPSQQDFDMGVTASICPKYTPQKVWAPNMPNGMNISEGTLSDTSKDVPVPPREGFSLLSAEQEFFYWCPENPGLNSHSPTGN